MSAIKIYLMGQFHVTLHDRPIVAFRSQRSRALFAYLVVEHARPLARTQLARLIWDQYEAEAARSNLRVSLLNLRQLFQPLELFHATYHTVQFDASQPDFWCDVLQFDTQVKAAMVNPRSLVAAEVRALFTREFLEGFERVDSAPFQEWLRQRRSFYHQQLGNLLNRVEAAAGLAPAVAAVASTPDTQDDETQPRYSDAPIRISTPTALIPEPGLFQGRETESDQLMRWIVLDRCRLVTILGMGGQGKSTLVAEVCRRLRMDASARLATEHASPFDPILWHSLVNAPPAAEVVRSWLETIGGPAAVEQSATLDQQVQSLLAYLQSQRCLLVLDNLESILTVGERAGYFRPGYEGYEFLIERIAQSGHQSVLLLTSREHPQLLRRLESPNSPIRSLPLRGLSGTSGSALLGVYGIDEEAAKLTTVVDRYSGNPLALRLVATTIQELFAGNVDAFLREAPVVFDDIRDVLDQHYVRLSAVEQEIMGWLAVEREPVTFPALAANLVQAPIPRVILESVRSLQRRSLLEQYGEFIGLQNVVIEYMTDRLINGICRELQDFGADESSASLQNPKSKIQNLLIEGHFNRFALVKAQAKEYVRASQVRLLLQPVAEWLATQWGRTAAAQHLQQMLRRLQQAGPLAPGYAGANILHLVLHLNIDVSGYDLAYLTIWQADLREADLLQVNLSGADLSGTLFLEPFEIMRGLTISPDGRLLATGAANGETYVRVFSDQQVHRIFKGHLGPVYSLAFSPDGQRLATASGDRTIHLWEVSTGELFCTLRGHTDEVVFVCFDATGESVLTISYDGTARLWDVRSQVNTAAHRRVFDILGPGVAYFIGAAISADGTLVATAGNDHRIRCWEVATGQLRCVLEGHTDYIDALAFSADGAILASAGQDQTVRIWEVASQADAAPSRLRYTLSQPGDYSTALAFSPEGATLASGGERVIRLWDVRTGQLRRQLPGHEARIAALAFHLNDVTLVSTSYDQTIRLWNASNGQAERTIFGRGCWVEEVSFSADGETLAGCYFDGAIRVWTPDGRQLYTLRGHTDPPRHIAYSPDGALLVSAGDDKTVRVWDVHTGGHRHTLYGHTDRVAALAFHPNSLLLASAGDDQMIHVWDMQTGEHCTQLAGRTPLAFGPGGALLAFSDTDRSIRLWDVNTGQLRVLPGHTARVRSLAFHPDGKLLVSASNDKTLRLWDVAQGQLLQTLGEPTQRMSHVAFSTDGRILVSVSGDQTIHIWMGTAEEGYQLRHTLVESIFKSTCIALSPDGVVLASGNIQTTIHLWEVETGQVRHTLRGHVNLITTVDFSPDGRTLLSGSSDGALRLWDVQTGACLNILQPEGPYAGMKISGITGVTEAQKVALMALGAVES